MSKIDWNQINSFNELLNFNKNYVLLFKHSPRCIVSRIAFSRFESDFSKEANISEYIFIDVLKMKSLSDEIAKNYSIYHESPQIILLKDNNVIFHTSHLDISFSNINKYIV